MHDDDHDARRPAPHTLPAESVGDLALLLIDQLPKAIAAAQATADTDADRFSTARFLEAWRDALVEQRQAASSASWVAAAIPRLFSVCEADIVSVGGMKATRISGQAAAALDTTLRLMHLHDRAGGTSVGESVMAMLLTDLARRSAEQDPEPSGTVH